MTGCSVDGCDKVHLARGLCAAHYARWRKSQPRPCSVAGCSKPLYARSWCEMHYRRWRLYGDPLLFAPKPTLRERIEARIARVPSGCWLWQGRLDTGGYGSISIDGLEKKVHRVAYELYIGPILEGLEIDHLCRNRRCCCPAHLEPVVRRENVRRGIGPTAINMAKTHCIRGHEFTVENTRVGRDGGRHCRSCQRIRNRRRRAA